MSTYSTLMVLKNKKNLQLLSEYTLRFILGDDIDESTKEYITQTTTDTKKTSQCGRDSSQTLQFLQDCPAESTVQHLATDSKDTAS